MPRKRTRNAIVTIIQNNPDGFRAQYCRLELIKTKEGYRVVAIERRYDEIGHGMVNFQVSEGQVKKIGTSIMEFFDLKAKEAKFKPTFHDFENKLKERYGEDGFYRWIIDWLREPFHKDRAKRLYDWLKEAERLGFFKGEK